MTRLDLPDGGWAELANPRKVPERRRARYRRSHFAFSAATADLPRDPDNRNLPDSRYLGEEAAELADSIAVQLILCLVTGWSFGEVNADVLEDIPGDAYDHLLAACRDLAADLMPDYSTDADPKARTGRSPSALPASSTAEPIYATTSSDGTS